MRLTDVLKGNGEFPFRIECRHIRNRIYRSMENLCIAIDSICAEYYNQHPCRDSLDIDDRINGLIYNLCLDTNLDPPIKLIDHYAEFRCNGIVIHLFLQLDNGLVKEITYG